MLFVSNSLLYQISNDRLPRCSSCILSTSIASFPNMVLERWIIDILSFILYHLRAPTWFSICLTYYTTYSYRRRTVENPVAVMEHASSFIPIIWFFFFTWVRQLKVLVIRLFPVSRVSRKHQLMFLWPRFWASFFFSNMQESCVPLHQEKNNRVQRAHTRMQNTDT